MRFVALCLFFCASGGILVGQTTQGVIRGDILDSSTGSPAGSCRVTATHLETAVRATSQADTAGRYMFPLLSPGTYILRAECRGFQVQELHNLELKVAAQLLVEFRLRPLDQVWEDRHRRSVFLPGDSVLTFFGPDVDTSRSGNFEGNQGTAAVLEPGVSQVIDSRLLRNLPLAGRDAYTMLMTQPGVTSDTTTTRSLGLSVNGQRPSASNFLLDGVENNDALVTGPLSPLPPEALGEYRITTNNFSAEYGNTSGFLANAITRAGTSDWHGILYAYASHHDLNASGLPGDSSGPPRDHERSFQPGLAIGGPVHGPNWFASGAFDLSRYRSRGEARTWTLPTQAFVQTLGLGTIARDLLSRFARQGTALTEDLTLEPPIAVNTLIGVPRLDWTSLTGRHRVFTRMALYRLNRPDYIFSPYQGFSLPLKRGTEALAAGYIYSRPGLTNELRASFSADRFSAERPHPEVPLLSVGTSEDYPRGLALPGTPVAFSYRNRTRNFELLHNVSGTANVHLWKAGWGVLFRRIDGFNRIDQDGRFTFLSVEDFAADIPFRVMLPLVRNTPVEPRVPDFSREYTQNNLFLFLQDNWRPWNRLSLSLGARYDRFGAPANTGPVKDQILNLGSGPVTGDLIAGATLQSSPGRQKLYETDTNDFSVRLGAAYSIRDNARTVLRAAYGIYYDRLFDNVWQTVRDNSVLQLSTRLDGIPRRYLDFAALLENLPSLSVLEDSPQITAFPSRLTTPLVHSSMAGIQHQLNNGLVLELNLLASQSRNLVTTDRLNRQASVPGTAPPARRRFNNAYPDLLYRAAQGRSNYRAISAVVRHRRRRWIWQASYTLSHTKDHQSDPVLGDFFDLGFSGAAFSGRASFTRQFDPDSDWGNADFDQRHNLAFYALTELPGVFRGWHFGAVGAIRSGFPFSVEIAPVIGSPLNHNRADVVAADRIRADRREANGGILLLNRDAFASPGARLGSSRRNAFYGPGLFNFDIALSRRFRFGWLGDTGAFGFRVDAFNILNHANLGNPVNRLDEEDFGIAYRGRTARPNAFRALGPLGESGRRLQLSVRLEF